ncbi:MAG: ATP-binding protein [Butyricicoccus sp.]|nr:ATP-binding protein [Butyricicoccus sp.]
MRKSAWLTVRRWNSRGILAFSFLAFLVVLCVILGSNRYMNDCVQREAQAKDTRTALADLGQQLADASDYLTDEVRKYSITGDIEHLKNYWDEVCVSQRRDTVIHTLEGFSLPAEESELLAEAKRNSDLLIDTETRSMKLMLLAQGQPAAADEPLRSYLTRVEAFPLEPSDTAAGTDLRETARTILYDAAYEQAKNEIMTPITQFQQRTAERLAREGALATAGRVAASRLQIGCLAFSLLLIAGLLWLLARLYILPLTNYTAALSDAPRAGMLVRVTPCGAAEPYRFGRMFNRLRATLERELENRRQAEAVMRQARDEADKASQAKSEFLAQMSHELRTPLGTVTGYLYLLEQTPITDQQRRYCRSMHAAANTLLGLISNILDFSKIEAGAITFEQTAFSPTELLQEVRDMLENSAVQKGLYFHLQADSLPAQVCGDPMRLRQVLVNLVGNAVKFTEHGGVTLSARCERQDGNGCTLLFTVADTGIGISPADQARIFEPFEQADASTSRRYGGTGLGLGIARRIVETASGGAHVLELESEPGHGATFRFRMDFRASFVPEHTQEGRHTLALPTGKTVLLVDDNEINLIMERELLESFGLHVETAESGKQALEKAAATAYDMVLLDIRMPDMDGYALARAIRGLEAYRTVPLLALTADAVGDVREKALAAGMNDYVTKPLRPAALQELLQRYFHLAAHAPETLATANSCLFHVEQALRTLGGDKEQLAALCARFVRSHCHSAEYIRIHLRNGHVGNARAILHDLVGLTGNLCCEPLMEVSRTLLDELHHGRMDSLDRFTELFDRTLEELRRYTAPPVRKDGAIPPAQALHRLHALCADYDLAAADWFEAHRDALQGALPHARFMQLAAAMERYDFEQAAALSADTEEGNGNVSGSAG